MHNCRGKWEARIYIKGLGRFYIGHGDTQEEAAQLFAKANKKYIVDGNELTGRAVDVRDVAEQPLIFRREDKWTSKYEGKSSVSLCCINSVVRTYV